MGLVNWVIKVSLQVLLIFLLAWYVKYDLKHQYYGTNKERIKTVFTHDVEFQKEVDSGRQQHYYPKPQY